MNHSLDVIRSLDSGGRASPQGEASPGGFPEYSSK